MDENDNENANKLIEEMITQESFACQNGNYKLACQCENTISTAFML